MNYDIALYAGDQQPHSAEQDARLRSDLDFLDQWERVSPRNTAMMLRASLLRRTSPDLVRRATARQNAG